MPIAALALFEAHRPQLAFLDIRMPGRSGLDVAAAIGAGCHIVFITAYDHYALRAFETGAVDCLLKPVETARLAIAVERIRKQLDTPPPELSALIAELDPDRFWQVHRGTIVRLDAVAGVGREDAGKQYVLLKGRPERLPVPRHFFALFRQM